jgi:hypothetical protein
VPVISKAIPVSIAKGSCHHAQYLPGGRSPLHQPVTASTGQKRCIYPQSMVTLSVTSARTSHLRGRRAGQCQHYMWLAEQA